MIEFVHSVRRDGGTALPVALIMLGLLTSLTLGFLALMATEPAIGANHMMNAQARAIAESGLERAIWALGKGDASPSAPGALANPMPSPVPAPYDGSQYVATGAGGFVVTVTNGAQANERIVTSVGYVPNRTNPVAVKKIQTTVTRVKVLDPTCAVCAGGESPSGKKTKIQIGKNASINASPASGAEYCAGVTPVAAVYSQGPVNTKGSPSISAPTGGVTIAQNQPAAGFTPFVLADADIAMVRSLAKANGTYYRGSQTFTSPPPNGLVFVDTPSGNPFTSASPSGDIITVDFHGTWTTGWSGWLVVAGSVQISGKVIMSGLIYAQNDLSLDGNANGRITGAVISTNRMDTSSTNVDTDDTGGAPVTYDCPAARDGNGTVPQGWFVKSGTYKEVAGS